MQLKEKSGKKNSVEGSYESGRLSLFLVFVN
jgi:hypothetical protein